MLPPAVFAGAALLAGWWRRRGDDPHEGPLWLAPVVVLIAYVGVHAALLGGLVAPRVAADWMPAVALAAAGLGLVAWRWRGPRAVLWGLRALVVLGVGVACTSGKIRHGWAIDRAAPVLGAFTAHTLASWWAFERLAARARGAEAPGVLMLYALACGQVVALAYYSLKVAQMPTAVAACMGAAAVVGIIRPRLSLARGGVDAPVLVTQAALFQGFLYSSGEGGAWYAPLLLGAPLAALLAGRLPLRGPKGTAARVVAAAVVAGVAIGLAIALRPASDS